jgi:hypothetical protein
MEKAVVFSLVMIYISPTSASNNKVYLGGAINVAGDITTTHTVWCTSLATTGNVVIGSDGNLTISGSVISVNNGANTLVASPVGINQVNAVTDQSTYFSVSTVNHGAYGVNWWASDERLKENIVENNMSALDIIMKIQHKSFDWKRDNTHVTHGFVAQELEQVQSEFVFKVKQLENAEFEELYQIDANKIVPYLTRAIQELKQEIDELKLKLGG